VFPNKESINAKKYVLARPTFYYTNGQPTGEAARFLDYTLSVEGQAMVEQVGFVPIHWPQGSPLELKQGGAQTANGVEDAQAGESRPWLPRKAQQFAKGK
jgi:hypothetical protein